MTRGRPDNQCIYPISARYTRELVVALETKSATQKQRTSLELVKDINTIINSNRDMITARYLLSRDILVAF